MGSIEWKTFFIIFAEVMNLRIVLAVDVGATNLRTALMSDEGTLLATLKAPTPSSGDKFVVARKIVSMFKELVGMTEVREIDAVGVGTIGPLNIRDGKVVGTPNNPLGTFELLRPLKNMLKVPVWVVNDCVAAVWGEYLLGAGRGYWNVVYVTISSGIGAGAVVNGHLLLGKDGNAHEVGHIVLDYTSNIKCGCGGVGHWEGLASGSNLWKLLKVLATNWSGEKTEFWFKAVSGVVSGEDLFRAWRRGDQFALSVINELVKINAAGLASVINVYDPEVLTVGGAIALNNPDFMNMVFENVKHYVMNRMPEIMLTPLREEIVLFGAGMIALNTPEELKELQS